MKTSSETLQTVVESFGATILKMESHCAGLQAGILALAKKHGDVAEIYKIIEDERKRTHALILERIEREDPTAAAHLDKRNISDLPDQVP